MKLNYIIVFLLYPLIQGCERDMNTDYHKYGEIQTELGLLPKLMSLPGAPVRVKWKVSGQLGQDNASLVALLRFSKGDYNHILDNSPAFDANRNESMSSELYGNWVPEEIKIQITVKESDGNIELIGVKALQPNLFTRAELSPFVNGSITPLKEGYILVHLYSM